MFFIFINEARCTMSGKPKWNLGLDWQVENAFTCLRDTGKHQKWLSGQNQKQGLFFRALTVTWAKTSLELEGSVDLLRDSGKENRCIMVWSGIVDKCYLKKCWNAQRGLLAVPNLYQILPGSNSANIVVFCRFHPSPLLVCKFLTGRHCHTQFCSLSTMPTKVVTS